MRSEDFTPESPGQLVAIAAGASAFVPAPLPRNLQLGARTIRLLGDARARLGVLVEGVRTLPKPDLLIKPFQKREAVLSSRIEGTRTTLEEAFVDDATGDAEVDEDALEVRNYEKALRLGVQALSAGRPISLQVMRGLHRELLRGVRGESKRPGSFRGEQVWLGGHASDGDVRLARFVPPPPEQVSPCLDDLERYLIEPGIDDPLIRVALAHYQFETIHPFLDGNGRVGRLMIALQMIAEGLMREPWLYVSPYLERERESYYRGLYRVSASGDYGTWIEFFIGAVLESANDTIDRLHRLRNLEQELRGRVQHLRTQKPAQLLPTLFANPYLTVPMSQTLLDTNAATAQQTVNKLVDAGIVERVTVKTVQGRGRPPVVYRSSEILDILRE